MAVVSIFLIELFFISFYTNITLHDNKFYYTTFSIKCQYQFYSHTLVTTFIRWVFNKKTSHFHGLLLAKIAIYGSFRAQSRSPSMVPVFPWHCFLYNASKASRSCLQVVFDFSLNSRTGTPATATTHVPFEGCTLCC